MSAVLPGNPAGNRWQRLRDRFARPGAALPWQREKDDNAIPMRMPSASYGRARSQQLTLANVSVDQALVWVIVALLLWGLVMVFSASIAMPACQCRPSRALNIAPYVRPRSCCRPVSPNRPPWNSWQRRSICRRFIWPGCFNARRACHRTPG